MRVIIKEATKNDTSLILNFILELAEYEKMKDEVVANEALLNEWIFEKHSANVLIIYEEDKPVGFALYFYNFSTFLGRAGIFLEDLYVNPSYRGKGYGKMLLKQLAKIAVNKGLGRLDWNCLDWNETSIKFYLSLGAQKLDMWTTYRISGQRLVDFARE